MKLPAPVLTAGGAGRRRAGVVGHMPASSLPGRSFEMLDNNLLPAFAKELRRGRLRFAQAFEAKSGGGGGNRINGLKSRMTKISIYYASQEIPHIVST